jgi:hypothetical protein
MNRTIELASGDWVMPLGDDHYLLPGAAVTILEAIRGARPEEAVLLFGVDIVNADGVQSRTQRFRRQLYLEPAQALERLLRNRKIFDRAAATGVVPEPSLRRWQADFLHQFILQAPTAGCVCGAGARPARWCVCLSCRRSELWGFTEMVAGARGIHGCNRRH